MSFIKGIKIMFKILFFLFFFSSKPYSESAFHRDFKNGKTIEFSCWNDGEIKDWDGCKICDTGEAGVTSFNIN